GDSEEEVLAYFVSKYGQWVLLDPPKEGFNLVVWLAPLVLLIGGTAVLAKVFAGWLRSSGSNEGTGEAVALDRPTPD
ncbi:MAG: cytochrome c-type biogenesis protein CcmH, partial [Gammaproteobacteria bacterium]|nr:cytochrome c-type biogenesis protein CcmH [Gemmatimonadota bacterium]NIU73538.1 cytochrome c-type biogenesis protein CcmH [Gammaproteobacteria bacterium]NIY07934.1 cytochrome c-type biogenesis protein CcmH [Gemmatimonadota bacterium]